MSSFNFRPRFQQLAELTPKAVEEKILEQTQLSGCDYEVKCFPGFLCIRIPEKERHFWSPRLHLDLEATDDGTKTQIRGIYGPNANVWGLFLCGYMILGVLAFIVGTFAFTQWAIGTYPWAFWPLGLILFAALTLYVMAQLGQKLGAQQTYQIHQIYESALGNHVPIH